MKTRYWKTEQVARGVRISLKENLDNVPSTMIIYLKRLKIAGLTLYPLTSSHVQLGVGDEEFIDYQIKEHGRIVTLETVDFTYHSFPYPVRGVCKVDFAKGLVMEFKTEKQEKLFLKRMDKALENLLKRIKTDGSSNAR